ncbi:hypothetical protein ASE14_04770 [Agromyces sp. Root81]|uniref:hypothetical protein n=1 Tax=Agromyces sp. Root81 TaxID=1736601 RepID=UPI0006F6B073|nr:hypothetical protein [Agromyces sp. Root81]KRC63094.1 hypothetical protein ASE14_04770 [Agromyces sp. Root81]
MHGRSKVAVPGETIAQLVAHHLRDAGLTSVRPLDEGMYNAAYLLAFADRPDAVVKVAPPEGLPRLAYEQHLMRAETEYFRLASLYLSLIMLAEGPPRGYRGLERALTVRYVRRRIALTLRQLA